MKKIFYGYNPWWEDELDLSGIFLREKYLSIIRTGIKKKGVLFFTGLRRVGKTTIIKLIIDELIKDKVKPSRIFYLSLDDYLLRHKSIIELVNEYRKLHRLKTSDFIYLFFDEITYSQDYQQQLKNLYDRGNVKIVVTSSSSSLLRDKKAYLTGRTSTIEVSPLDFKEYLLFKNVNIKVRDSHLLESFFEEFMRVGGLPENVLHPSREYLMNLVDDIIQKDITAFYGLKNHEILRDFFMLLMERSGKQFSINKIANILKISPDTARRYLNYFEWTYLVHLLPRWGTTNEKLLSAKKIYACDLGIKYLFVGDRDLGSYFENYVYLQLRKKAKVYYIYKDGNEIDFFTNTKVLIEAKYYGKMSVDQEHLFNAYPSKKKVLIDSVEKLSLIDDIVI